MLRFRAPALALAVLALGSGCSTYRDQLARGQRAFEQNDHDRTLAILRDLEPDMTRLNVQDQAAYAYLRGMSDYRIGYKADARHWLALAKAYEDASPGVLPGDWKARTNEALDELNGVVYAQGTSALSTSRRTDVEDPGANRKGEPVPGDAKTDGRDAKEGVPAGASSPASSR